MMLNHVVLCSEFQKSAEKTGRTNQHRPSAGASEVKNKAHSIYHTTFDLFPVVRQDLNDAIIIFWVLSSASSLNVTFGTMPSRAGAVCCGARPPLDNRVYLAGLSCIVLLALLRPWPA